MKHLLLTTIAAVVLVGCGGLNIWEAAEQGNIEAVKQHLDAGVNVNKKDQLGETPLHSAAKEGHMQIIELLITKGADVNAMDDGGHTPVDWAESVNEQGKHEGKNETVALLRKHGGKTGEELKAEGK